MNSTPPTLKSKESKAGAGIAGVGTGTGLVALANSLPDSSQLKPWLLLAAPAVSIAASAIWLWAQVEIANFVQDVKIKLLARRLRTHLKNAIQDPSRADGHKKELQDKLYEVDLIIADRDLGRLKSMTPVTADRIPKATNPTVGGGAGGQALDMGVDAKDLKSQPSN